MDGSLAPLGSAGWKASTPGMRRTSRPGRAEGCWGTGTRNPVQPSDQYWRGRNLGPGVGGIGGVGSRRSPRTNIGGVRTSDQLGGIGGVDNSAPSRTAPSKISPHSQTHQPTHSHEHSHEHSHAQYSIRSHASPPLPLTRLPPLPSAHGHAPPLLPLPSPPPLTRLPPLPSAGVSVAGWGGGRGWHL